MVEITIPVSFDMKACKKCGELKPFDKFPKCVRARDGRAGSCHACYRLSRSEAGKARELERFKGWKKRNPDRWRDLKRAQSERRRRRLGQRSQAEIQIALKVERETQERRKAKELQLDRARRISAKPWLAPGLSQGDRWRIRYQNDPIFHLSERLRTAGRKDKCGRFGELLRSAVRQRRSLKLEALFGYTAEQLRNHLERQFDRDMTWTIFMTGAIHIDHIRPLSSFDLSDLSALRDAWSLSNLRPLWAEANVKKGRSLVLLL